MFFMFIISLIKVVFFTLFIHGVQFFYIYGTNHQQMAQRSNRKILLVFCGTLLFDEIVKSYYITDDETL